MRSEGGEFGLDFGAFRGFSPTSSFQSRLLGKRRPLTIRDAMKPSLQLGVGDGVSSGNARRLIKWRFFLFFFFTVSKARVVMSCFKKKKKENTKASNAVIHNQNDENENEKEKAAEKRFACKARPCFALVLGWRPIYSCRGNEKKKRNLLSRFTYRATSKRKKRVRTTDFLLGVPLLLLRLGLQTAVTKTNKNDKGRTLHIQVQRAKKKKNTVESE